MCHVHVAPSTHRVNSYGQRTAYFSWVPGATIILILGTSVVEGRAEAPSRPQTVNNITRHPNCSSWVQETTTYVAISDISMSFEINRDM